MAASKNLTPQERRLRAQISADESWARTDDRTARTSKARQAFIEKFEREVDPENKLPPAERARRAEHLRKAHYARMAFESSKARRRRRENGAA